MQPDRLSPVLPALLRGQVSPSVRGLKEALGCGACIAERARHQLVAMGLFRWKGKRLVPCPEAVAAALEQMESEEVLDVAA